MNLKEFLARAAMLRWWRESDGDVANWNEDEKSDAIRSLWHSEQQDNANGWMVPVEELDVAVGETEMETWGKFTLRIVVALSEE